MIKCIIHVEWYAGAVIYSIVSDWAQTNQKMWSKLSFSEQIYSFENWFTHPLDNDQKIYAFSGTPYLFKNF